VQFSPNVRKIGFLSTKQVDSLTAGDLRVQFVLGRDFADSNELFRVYLPAWNTGNNGEGSIPLYIR